MKLGRHKGLQRMLAMLFAVAMVVTSIPQAGMTSYAAGVGSTEETVVETVEVSEEEIVTVEATQEQMETEAVSEEIVEETISGEPASEEATTEAVALGTIEGVIEQSASQPGILSDGEGDDGSVSGNEVYTFTFVPDEHVTIYDADGVNEITQLTVPVGSSDEVYFTVKLDEGYTVRSARSNLGNAYLTVSGSWNTGLYRIRPGKKVGNVYTSDATITVTSTLIADYTANFSYDSNAVEFSALKDGEAVTLTDGALIISNTESLSFLLKEKEGYKITGVTYTIGTGEDAYTDTLYGYDDDEDGYYEYSVGRLFEDHQITISAKVWEECTITLTGSEYINFWDVECYDDGSGEIYYQTNGEVSGAIKTGKNEPFYFAAILNTECGSLYLTTTGDENGRLNSIGTSDSCEAVYMVTPTEDMTISAVAVPYTIPLKYNEGLFEDIQITCENNSYPVSLSEDKKSLEMFSSAVVDFRIKPAAGRQFYSAYYIWVEDYGDGEIYKSNQSWQDYTVLDIDENGYYVYRLGIGGESQELYTEAIVFEEGHKISFNVHNATITDYSYSDVTDDVLVGEDYNYHFKVTPAERYTVLYVTTTGDESGKIESVYDEVMGDYYYTVKVTEDMTITVVTEAANKQITFVNECASMNYAVTSAVIEEGNYAPSGDCYYIHNDEDKFTFDVTVMDGNAQPDVMLRDNKGKDTILQGTQSTDEDGNRIFSYTVAASAMTSEMTIYISDANAPKQLTVMYDSSSVSDVTITVDDMELAPANVSENDTRIHAVYEIAKGATAVLSVQSGERYYLSYINVDNGTEQLTYDVTGTSYSGQITMDVNTFISIGTRGKVFTTVKMLHEDGRETELERVGSSYCVVAGHSYKVTMVCGDSPVHLTNVRGKTLSDEIELQICEDDTSSFIATIPEDYFGSSSFISVSGTYEIDGSSRNINQSINFRIVGELHSVDVKAPAKVYPDRYAVYTYTANRSTTTPLASMSLANTGVEITLAEGVPENSVIYDWKPALNRSGKLRICASARAGYGEVATVRLYNKTALPTDENYYIEGSEFTFTVMEPTAFFESTPEVKITASDDVSMTLQLDTPYESGCVNGKQYYKIDVIPQTVEGKDIPASIVEACAKPFFVVREFPEYDDEGNEIPGFVQKEKLALNTAGLGLGQAWKYDVKVTLVQTYDKTELTSENMVEQIAFSSKTLDLGEVATKEPAFSTKLSLQKKSTQVYTNQKNVVAANVKYDKGTVCADATAKDITECADNEKLSVKVENNQLVVSATANTKLGKHTILVSPMAPSTLYRQDATIVVTVVKGIEKLKVALPSDTIYKQNNKEATLTASIVYNEGDTAPKTKKVTWELVDENGNTLNQSSIEVDDEGNEIEVENPLKALLTIKNGKVTVNKKLDVSENPQTFRIKVKAADFAGNTTTALSDVITISNQYLQLGEMFIVQKNEATSVYKVVAKNGDTVTTDKLQNAQLVVLKAGETVKDFYTEENLNEAKISASLLTVKSSASKSIALTKETDDIGITSGKPAKNIKLTVTTNDGGKKSATMKVTVGYTDPEALALRVSEGNDVLNNLSSEDLSVSFNGTVNSKLTLSVMQKTNDENWDELYAYTNHTVSVKGGKILSSDVANGKYVIVVSADKATVTLKDKVNNVTKRYTIINNNYSKTKAPSVKIKKNTPGSIVCGVLANRSLEYQITSKTYSYTNKVVMIESQAVSAVKKPADYAAFMAACDKAEVYTSVTDGTLKLNFADTNIPLGSYKLTLTFGTKTGDTFIADAKPVTLTVKVVKAKATKGSYKANAVYKNIEATAGNAIELTGKAKNLHSVTYTGIVNANVKGKENKFLDYFRLEDNKLIIREDLTPAQLTALKSSKTDNYGYLTYTAVYGDDGYGNPFTQTKTVKVTIKLKK